MSAGTRGKWVRAAIILALIVLIYHHIAIHLVHDWYELPDFSHGFLIPFFVLYVLWDKRRILAATRRAPSWYGFTVLIPAILILLLGVLGADLFLSRFSFVLMAIGLVW
ncbi:MAG: archaeosortase/exosortase family protein, partial [Bryocella sp.]